MSTKPNKKPKTNKETKVVPGYATAEAWKWLISWVWAPKKETEDSAEPKAYPPLWYVGPELLQKYSDAVGDPLTLEDVQYMIRLDGDEEATCTIMKTEFIPICYASDYIPDDVMEKLQSGTPISEAGIYMRGQFNVIKREVFPLSGSIYREARTPSGEKVFDYAYQSCIVMLATKIMAKRKKTYPIWTCVSRESLESRKERNAVRGEIHDKLWAMAHDTDNDYWERKDRKSGKIASVGGALKNALRKGADKAKGRRPKREQEEAGEE